MYLIRASKQSTDNTSGGGGKKCPKHQMEIVLFCKQKTCQTGICVNCLMESHQNHRLVNIKEEKSNDVVTTAKALMECLDGYENTIKLTQLKVEESSAQAMKELAEGKENQMKQLKSTLAEDRKSVV